MRVDLGHLTPAEKIVGDSASETLELKAAISKAQDYLREFKWCGGIAESYVGISVPGIVMVILHRIVPLEPEVDEWLWTVTGDLPPAYLVTDEAETAERALEGYLGEMRAWVEAVRFGQPTDELIPVNAPATAEYAEMLDRRLKLLEQELLEGEGGEST